MREVILLKDGEISLKGLNKSTFEQILIKNIKKKVRHIGEFSFFKSQSTIYMSPNDNDVDLSKAVDELKKVFGIATVSRAAIFPKDLDQIKQGCIKYLDKVLQGVNTFKVESKRADKLFPIKSPTISSEVGHAILSNFDHLKVDVHNPDICVNVEIREKYAYIYCEKIEGARGMPLGSSGKGLLLISGGLDSPVAGYMMSKRGLEIEAIHFLSPPYTSERALKKVSDLCEKLCAYNYEIKLHCINFTDIQVAIKNNIEESLSIIVMRRIMLRIAEKIALKRGIKCLITGESIAQVASQTLDALCCTNDVCTLPVFRPLIGMDKNEIVDIARKIDTFDTSILPYEDCCTIFTPKHPKTKPVLEKVQKEEEKYNFDELIESCIENMETKILHKV